MDLLEKILSSAGLIFVTIILTTGIYGEEIKGGEYCEFEAFEAECGPGEVIVMKGARYGRMRLGRCVSSDLGYVGCSTDVIDLADQRCSGRRRCKIRMPDEAFSQRQECLTELKTYLEANYTCQKVTTVDHNQCQRCNFVNIQRPEGYIASVVTEESGCGSPECPWMIQALAGQRINISLVNFNWEKKTQAGGSRRPPFVSNDGCQVYATIKEDTATQTETICSRDAKHSHVYTSLSHTIELRIVGRASPSEEKTHFLLQYEAIGCPDPQPPLGGWQVRSGEVITRGCNGSRDTWTMTCVNKQWNNAKQSCKGYQTSPSMGSIGGMHINSGLSIVIIIAIALIVGAVILCLGFILVRRRYSRPHVPAIPPPPPAAKLRDMEPYYKEPMYMPPPGYEIEPTKLGDGQMNQMPPLGGQNTGSSYMHIWERPLPQPSADSKCSCPSSGAIYDTTSGDSNDYDYNSLGEDRIVPARERPQMYGNNTLVRKECDRKSPASDDPRYYQLDLDTPE